MELLVYLLLFVFIVMPLVGLAINTFFIITSTAVGWWFSPSSKEEQQEARIRALEKQLRDLHHGN